MPDPAGKRSPSTRIICSVYRTDIPATSCDPIGYCRADQKRRPSLCSCPRSLAGRGHCLEVRMQTGIAGLPAPQLRDVRWIDGSGEERGPLSLDDLGDGYRILYFFQHWCPGCHAHRSEEHTSELQSLMRISYAVFCL